MAQRLHPVGIIPADSADGVTIVEDGSYLLDVEDGRIVGLIENAATNVSYAEAAVTTTVARDSTSGTTWTWIGWEIAHDMFWRVHSFTCDIAQADTYILSIDGRDVSSKACTAASSANVFTCGVFLGVGTATPKALTPGPHIFRLRPTTAPRTFYYNNDQMPAVSGTYTSAVAWGSWMDATVISTPPGTLTWDAEGALS